MIGKWVYIFYIFSPVITRDYFSLASRLICEWWSLPYAPCFEKCKLCNTWGRILSQPTILAFYMSLLLSFSFTTFFLRNKEIFWLSPIYSATQTLESPQTCAWVGFVDIGAIILKARPIPSSIDDFTKHKILTNHWALPFTFQFPSHRNIKSRSEKKWKRYASQPATRKLWMNLKKCNFVQRGGRSKESEV